MSKMYATLRRKSHDQGEPTEHEEGADPQQFVVTGQSELLQYMEALERKEKRAAARAASEINVATGTPDDLAGENLCLSEVVAAREQDLLGRVRKLREKLAASEKQTGILTHELSSREKETLAGNAAHVRREGELQLACKEARAEAQKARAELGRREEELRSKLDAIMRQQVAAGNEIARLKSEVAAADARARDGEQALEHNLEERREQGREIAALEAMSAALQEKIALLLSERRKENESWQRAAGAVQEIDRFLARIETDSGPATSWRLRLGTGTGKGKVYGPLDIRVLRGWAAEHRIGPDHEVSSNGKGWKPAHRLAELQMTWNVTLVDGQTYGPLHISAANALVADGCVSADAEVKDSATGRKCKGRDLAVLEARELREEIARLAETMDSRIAAVAELKKGLQGLGKLVKRARAVGTGPVAAKKPDGTNGRRIPPVQIPVLKS